MPTRAENQANWTHYDWSKGGDDWSVGWGSSRTLWFGSLLPRIHFLLPARHLLEIAPGYGRVTAFLLEHCERYTGVDITPRCVDACRERFAGRAGASFHLNDGASLEVVADGSLDAAVSWDSLVHADPGVLEAYAHALARKLAPGGRAFLHHSNLGAHVDPATGRLPVENPHWRDQNMTAALMRRFAAEAGLALDGQELVQWGSSVANDCFTWLRRPGPGEAAGTGEVLHHPAFGAEMAHLRWLYLYPGQGKE
jgi:SAM-dependent methyltransferase